ncbi:amino acid/amide ABC transporter substrate-binding protein, HAAT family [Collimonas sp. OK607]|uniref:ABC transporter substrate-binding protein n=1 Tax=Collimonas sp. OK607 TaxID=1798194 RepID=UPI0008DF4A35|nr:ABC transporter substrate-binding protein [Collimonas sp. OK607]SFB38268.1 amino acid/amide ABC transporter substrate-binding protein, HAAT family [Collimonas sp. OK607]
MNSQKCVPALMAGILLSAAALASAQVKIGLVAPLSGSQAMVGQDQIDGFMLAVEQLGNKLGGQTVTIFKEDDQLKPEIGIQITRKFLDKDKVDAIVGLGFSNVLMASLKPIVESGTVAIATNAGPSPIAGASCAPNVFSVAWQNDGAAEATGKYIQDKGHKSVYLMAPNYQAGKDMLAGFKRFYKGQIVDEVYTQVGQSDYSAEIAQLQASTPAAVFAFYPGGMGVNYIKQLSQAGLLGKFPNYSVFTVDGTTMPALRDAAVGTLSGAMWDAALDNPENRKFVAAFEAKYRRTPSEYAATAFDAAQLLDVAIRKVAGRTSDKKVFAAAVKASGQEFSSVRGPFRFNNNNFPIQNYYVFQVAKESGKPAVKLLGTPLPDHKDAYYTKCQLK